MRIKCASIDSFIENLRNQSIYGNTVYLDHTRNPLNGTMRDAISWEVTTHITAILDFPDGGQALLDCGVNCGIDHDDSADGQDGTKLFKRYEDRIESYCEEYGLMVKPGVVDM